MVDDNIFEFKHITKLFPGIVALKDVSIAIKKHEILGLVGENGAGKSTLMKIMVGLNQADKGEMILRGKKIILRDPDMAMRHGIGMVFQEGCMIPNLTIEENIFLCHEDTLSKFGFLAKSQMFKKTKEILNKVKLTLNPNTLVTNLNMANKQMVEIARLIWLAKLYKQENPILILDEPTTVLNEEEVKTLFSILNDLKKESSIIFISHRLEEVINNTSRIIILKDGEFVKEMESQEAKIADVEKSMVGYGFSDERYHESEQGKVQEKLILEIKDLEIENKFKSISFFLRKGEIIGLVGLVGSGKEDVCKCLFGLSRTDNGEIRVNGKHVSINSPNDAINNGIGYIPIDRRGEGLALDMSVMDNINLLVLKKLKKGIFLNSRLEKENAQYWVRENKIKTSSLKMKTANLSGGNQQKAILSKWLSSDLKILIADHITRGIDVGAKDEIYEQLHKLSNAGMSIIVMCDTLEEDIGLSHRLILMKDGNLVREVVCPKDNKPKPIDILKLIV